ncbi:glycosyltransferase family 8 protein [Spirosoma agri]|uniref:Glycosyltransferase family 8 protein n=2 Tax=Spirosoma agri TaxID=1987381 RepID=A0A6M0IHT8_9BACT|nr:glycosyltransferase family 8 protein [Spirosoma agri]
MNIAFCVNKLGLIGLGATICSLIRNCSNTRELKIFILCNSLSIYDKDAISKLFDKERYLGKHSFISINPDLTFGQFRSLHGDFTPYGRLLLGDLINESMVLYLDSDLIVEVDVLGIRNFNFNGRILAAVEAGQLKTALENKFYVEKLALSPQLSSFNSGVLLFNLDRWRSENVKEKCLNMARQYPNDLLSCDQSILNGLFAGNFEQLPPAFNCPWYAGSTKPDVSDKMIIHFVGSPKPWDIFGILTHNGYYKWQQYLSEDWSSSFKKYSYNELKRAWKIRRSYVKLIVNKILANNV